MGFPVASCMKIYKFGDSLNLVTSDSSRKLKLHCTAALPVALMDHLNISDKL